MTDFLGTRKAHERLDKRSDREVDILRAAYHVIAKIGSNRLTLQHIADEASTSKGLILYHFKTKNTVLQDAMVWALLQTEYRIRLALERSNGPDLLRDVLDAIYISPERNRNFQFVYLDLVEAAARDDDFTDLPAIVKDIVEGLYREVIRNGIERGLFSVDDVADAGRKMRIVIDGSFILWVQDSDWSRRTHERLKRTCLDMLRSHLRA